MNIAIIGAGNIGGTLGKKWAAAGHQVSFGVRSPADNKHNQLRGLGLVTGVEEALADCEVILLSLPGGSVAVFAEIYGPLLDDKVVVDATNNIRSSEMNNLAVLFAQAPGAKLVRAFSNLGWENFETPTLGGETIDLFYCAQPLARAAAEQLITEVGLRPVCLGDLDTAPLVDSLTRLWFNLALTQGRGRRIAFKLLEENHRDV